MTDHLYKAFIDSSGVSTDTRSIQKDNLWFALKGPNFNANQFARKALDAGAIAAVVDDPDYVVDDRCILVDDGLQALQQLANYHRRQFTIPVLGITGSNGKTTTKELVRDVLARKYKVLATRGNLNNHIGVPLTLLRLTSEIEIAIIEMGANHQKEIAQLSAIAEPNYGLITNIGKAHLEGFGGIEGVFKGKTELYDFISQNGGGLFVNSRNERLLSKARAGVKEVYTYPDEGNDYSAELITSQPEVEFKTNSGKKVRTHLSGTYNYENICAALCIGKYFEVNESEAIAAVSNYLPENNRSQVIQHGNHTIYLDAYNANPTSMSLSVQNFAAVQGYKVVILGDMFELGEAAPEEHTAIGELTAQLDFDQVIFCGELMKDASKANSEAQYFKEKADLETYLKAEQWPASSILIKGSRGMSLETLLNSL
ncbi:UDP-N-acetylmuramoyl-tripeptide--D-alanyl-D-alanine ligase [Roseivirga sp.]|uniref:UDP-N-acetylmuramoyl-tripeptide--D-alanyl-D- alanine ligase n=1 Tax=Roseivirga sp. TaxID=1964215 RepID=UPI003B5213E9